MLIKHQHQHHVTMALDTPAAPQAPAAPGAPAAPKPGVPLQMELTPAMRSFLRAASQDARLTQVPISHGAACHPCQDSSRTCVSGAHSRASSLVVLCRR